MTVITDELVRQGENGSGGWNREQLKIIGVGWPPRRGWIRRAIGKVISDDDAARFVSMKGKTIRKSRVPLETTP